MDVIEHKARTGDLGSFGKVQLINVSLSLSVGIPDRSHFIRAIYISSLSSISIIVLKQQSQTYDFWDLSCCSYSID